MSQLFSPIEFHPPRGTVTLANRLVIAPIGFISDHMEVLYDLDIEAKHRSDHHGLTFDRTSCVNDDAVVMAALAQRVLTAAQS